MNYICRERRGKYNKSKFSNVSRYKGEGYPCTKYPTLSPNVRCPKSIRKFVLRWKKFTGSVYGNTITTWKSLYPLMGQRRSLPISILHRPSVYLVRWVWWVTVSTTTPDDLVDETRPVVRPRYLCSHLFYVLKGVPRTSEC